MSEKRKVVIPTGFIEVTINLENGIPVDYLAFLPSAVDVYTDEGKFIERIPLTVGMKQIITLKPGKFMVRAILGKLASETITVEVEAGKMEKLVFHFGKDSAQ